MTTISSPRNPLVRHAIRLRDNRYRQKQRQVIVDGIREIQRAIDSGWQLQQLLVAELSTVAAPGSHAPGSHAPGGKAPGGNEPGGNEPGSEPSGNNGPLGNPSTASDRWAADRHALIQAAGQQTVWLTEPLLAQIAYGKNPREAVAIFRQPDDLSLGRLGPLVTGDRRSAPLVVVMVGIEKPGNAGAIFRSADAMGADAVILCDTLCDLGNPNLIRASLGTAFTVPWAQADEAATLTWLQRHGFQAIAAIVDAPRTFWQADYRAATALIVGSESHGLNDTWRRLAASGQITAVQIPMLGVADSLNVSVAAAALLFEARRQRGC